MISFFHYIKRQYFFGLLLFSFFSSAYSAPVEIMFWHSLAGQLGTEVTQLADGFNKSQDKYQIKTVYKGDYIECLTSLAAAFRAGQAPALVQVFEVGATTLLTPRGVIKPIHEVLSESNVSLPEKDFFPSVKNYYSDTQKLMGFPFNISIPVMFYNADALRKVGYTKDNFPKNWEQLETLAQKLIQAGYPCAYTTANPAWIFVESFSAVNGLELIDQNTSAVLYNNKAVLHHLGRLRRWQQEGYFEYGGRTDDSTILFTSGRCPLYSQSSGSYNSLAEIVPFQLGMTVVPHDKLVSKKRFGNISGGGALWAMQGQSRQVYAGIAQFIAYLSKPEIQLHWHEHTGYLPLGTSGVYQLVKDNSTHPSLPLAGKELAGEPLILKKKSRMQNQIRIINDEAIEAIFSGIQSPETALNKAVSRANHVLRRFKRNTRNLSGEK